MTTSTYGTGLQLNTSEEATSDFCNKQKHSRDIERLVGVISCGNGHHHHKPQSTASTSMFEILVRIIGMYTNGIL